LQRLPEISEFLKTAQYDILIAMGDGAAAEAEKSGRYLSALALSPKRMEAINGIKNLAAKMDAAGKNEEAVRMLRRALEITPAHPTLTEQLSDIARVLEIFVTATMGCGNENSMISNAPMTIGELNLCIRYKNMIPDSIVTVVFSHESTRKSEVPVVLQGRSGRTAVTVSAPLEGFTPGEYVIAAMQGASILSETRIQFNTPKRR
jgi:tetratricopeptide (TPR) repeat protein